MINDRYQNLREIGSGGIGKVLCGVDRLTGKTVAIKVLLNRESELVDRFKKEFSLLKKIHHPNIVQVYDFGIGENGEPYFSMEYVRGKDWMDFHKPLDYDKFLSMLVQVCGTLDFLHCRRIIHGDLKPSNILVTESSTGRPVPKFTDFGFAEYGQTKDSAWWRGSLSYLAPEVIRGERYSHQADLYSLGVMIYETLFGRRPFEGDKLSDLAKSHLEQEVTIPQEPSFHTDLRGLILGLLEKDPIDRFFSAREVLKGLHGLADFQNDENKRLLAKSLIQSVEFQGREKELAELEEALDQVSKGGSRLVLLTGEEGVGKSRLLQEFKTGIQLEDASVLEVSLLKPEFIGKFLENNSQLCKGTYSPCVLILENLELAFDSTRELVQELIHQTSDKVILICMSLNNGYTRSEKDQKAFRIEQKLKTYWDRRITPIKLKNLTMVETRELVDSMFSWKGKTEEIATGIFEKTGGSPLLVRQVMVSLAEDEKLKRVDGQWMVETDQIDSTPIPKELVGEMEARLNRLSPDELDLLSLASVVGGEFETSVLKGVSKSDDRVFQRRLENIFLEGLLLSSAESSGKDRLIFPSGFARELVYQRIQPTKRKDLHQRVGAFLENRCKSDLEGHSDQLAEHFYRTDDERAFRYSLLAARKAEKDGRRIQAVNQYLRVLELYDKSSPPESCTKAELFGKIAEQFEAEGDYQRSLQHFKGALELWEKEDASQKLIWIYRRMARIHGKKSQHEQSMQLHRKALLLTNQEDSPREYASVLIDIAWDHRNRCEYQEAEDYLHKAIFLLERLPSSKELGNALHCMAGVQWSLGNYPQAMESLSKSLDVFQKLGEVQKTAECYIALGLLLRGQGQPEKALEYYQKALGIMESSSDSYRLSVLQNNLGIAYMDLNRWDQALSCLSESVELKTQISDLKGLALSYNNMGLIYLKKGLFNKALDCFSSTLQFAQEIRDRSCVASVYFNLADLHRCREEWNRASHYLERSLHLATEIGEESRLADCLLLKGRIATERSDFDSAERSLNQAAKLFAGGKNRFGEAEVQLELAELTLRMRKLNRAEKLLRQIEPFIQSLGNKWYQGSFTRTHAGLLRAKGEEGGLNLLQQSCDIFKQLGARYELGKSYLELGKLKLETGRIKEARAFLREAANIFGKSEVEGKRKETETLQKQINRMHQGERERIQTFYRLADLLNSVWDTDELLSKALELVIELLNAERGAIILYSEEDKTFELKVSFGLEQETSEDAIDISRRVLCDVVESNLPLIVENAADDKEFSGSKSVKMHNILSILCVPLKTKNRLIGTVYLDHRSLPAVFASEDIDFLKAFSCLIATAIEKSELYVKANDEIFQLKEVLSASYQYPDIVGKSAKMQEIFDLVEKIADTKASVLIYGENGTGKELIAKLIHARSQRKDGPFIRVNCAALPEALLESELFGIEEKTATDVGFRKGKFELADGGEIFLDEIGDMSFSVQAKVLRVLQEKEFERVGGQKSLKVDIRIISATNQDLEKKVKEGTFRKDLYYRLNPIVINIPPLRDRKEDIPDLVFHFVKKLAKEHNRPEIKVTKKIMSALSNFGWPGNVRELENIIERAILLSKKGEFPKEVLPEEAKMAMGMVNIDRLGTLPEIIDWVEKTKIIQALERNKWNQVKAAEELGLTEASLRRRIKKHKIKKTARTFRRKRRHS
jgi:Nif-specific regulatory protein